ncbi:MAG: hypothetical protein LAT62_10950 [Natronospirillum sp.]|uniref:glycogen debranching N-terminal domain-containing protein n=1 Tax=Natronospirillum sp. TaxID=2812955 RepID=UPI0025DDD78C|nr:glycogen debranching N-terminal domain-containing protein [Natronospirillum sp.]MCH8552446.1 hypothetical protein [Natronospirillum sp.]
MIPLKHNFAYCILDSSGRMDSDMRESGFYFLDTRVLSQYKWSFAGFDCLHRVAADGRQLTEYWSRSRDHRQELAIRRQLRLSEGGFRDVLAISNTDHRFHRFQVDLALNSDFADMFEVRGQFADLDHRTVTCARGTHHYHGHYKATDDAEHDVRVHLTGADFHDEVEIPPGKTIELVVEATVSSSLPQGRLPLQLPEKWLGEAPDSESQGVYEQACADLSCLLLATDEGLTVAAGMPWFVTPFGRDAIITAWFLLPRYPELALGVLRFLGHHQGQHEDSFRDEQPGKILHEQRYGELSRTGCLPFQTYYGSADSTPLYLLLLADTVRRTGRDSLIGELRPHWEAGLNWMMKHRDERGLIVFRGNDRGLTIQSWKDSNDSLSYADGTLGQGALAVAEVQGYAFAAFQAAAQFYAHLGDQVQADNYLREAQLIRQRLHDWFWMPEHDNFAIALDEQGRKLDVNSSDSGHLLWTGVVFEDKAARLVPRMLRDDMWSGWGLRTLSTEAHMYNPLSYHNGSVWPHDTALFAAGLKRYGFNAEFDRVTRSLVDLASSQSDRRLPELVGGYSRETHPPLPYLDACRPQAWSAAAMVYLLTAGEQT